jgi:transposase
LPAEGFASIRNLEGRKEVEVENLSTTELIANPVISEWKLHTEHSEVASPPSVKPEAEKPFGLAMAKPEAPTGRGKLGPYLPYLLRMVEDQPRAKIKDFYLALMDRGYSGSYDLVKKKIHTFRRELGRQATAIFSAHDAPYAQVEITKVKLKGPKQEAKALLFTMILGHSGRYYSELIDTNDMGSFLQCHHNAFVYFGGVPAGVFYDPQDNPFMRRLVGTYPFHLPIVDCAMHYHFLAQATPVFAPWMKGRLTRPGKIIKKLFALDYAFTTLPLANQELLAWVSILSRKQQLRQRKDLQKVEKLGELPSGTFNFRGRKHILRLVR